MKRSSTNAVTTARDAEPLQLELPETNETQKVGARSLRSQRSSRKASKPAGSPLTIADLMMPST